MRQMTAAGIAVLLWWFVVITDFSMASAELNASLANRSSGSLAIGRFALAATRRILGGACEALFP
jgi:hypothetical protein